MPRAPRPAWALAAVLVGTILLLAPTPSHAAWPTDPAVNVPVSAWPTRFTNPPVVAPDSCGGALVAWEDVDATLLIPQLYIQRVDAFGQVRWPAVGVAVRPPHTQSAFLDVAPDGDGGAYVAYSIVATAASGRDVFVQHILSSGVVDPAWPANGVAVCEAAGDQGYPQVVPDGFAGAVVVWPDQRGNVDFGYDVYAQRISSTGTTLWTPNGVPVIAAPGPQFANDIAAEPSGGVFVVFTSGAGEAQDLFAQRLDGASGSPLWPASGLPLCTESGRQDLARAAADAGRLLVAWTDWRGGTDAEIYAQAVGITGATLWTPNGVLASTTSCSKVNPKIVNDGVGGGIVTWDDYRFTSFDNALYAQRLGPTGARLWAPGGVEVDGPTARHLFTCLVPDQRGGAIAAWTHENAGGIGNSDVRAQRLSETGAVLWPAPGVDLSTAPNNQSISGLVTDGAGGAVAVWQDDRAPDVDVDIYAQEVGAGGQVGIRGTSRNCEPDICGKGYTDFGDAPEGTAFDVTGAVGRFPTCMTDHPPGTQEIECGSALSTAPGQTGYVRHVGTFSDAASFGLGCGQAQPFGLDVDSEADGAVRVGAPPQGQFGVSVCSPGVTIGAYEVVAGGLTFGVDEALAGPDAGLDAQPLLLPCSSRSFDYKAWSCAPDPLPVYLNVLVDWNRDGDWNDVVACPAPSGFPVPCAPEWAVKNVAVVLAPGCNTLTTPDFLCGPNQGTAWMRVTLTPAPVSNDFPWRGSAPVPPATAPDFFAGGETEDYVVTVRDPVAVTDPALPAGALSLAPLAPNPARGTTTVSYALPRATTARVEVFDLTGRLVRTLARGAQPAGPHATTWDGTDDAGARVPAGMYFIRVEADGATQSRSIVRLR